MLPVATAQCSLGFSLLQSVIGGTFGSLGFIANLLVLKWLFARYQSYQQSKSEARAQAEPVNRVERRFLHRKQRV